MFKKEDLRQFEEKHISPERITEQIENFKAGFPFIKLIAAATPEHGIEVLSEGDSAQHKNIFDEKSKLYTITKMVPASGAASRMFKSLHAFLDGDHDKPHGDVAAFFDDIKKFAFYDDLEKVLKDNGHQIDDLLKEGAYKTIVRYLLTDEGLSYSSLPKGLLMFHAYPDGARTPLEEHMVEGQHYSKNANDRVKLHFTVSPEHIQKFNDRASAVISNYTKGDPEEFDISYSVQKPSTDTIAVDLNNAPFRNADGSILFRPGGHGALIENLNELDSDIAFIKNIDNIVPDRLKDVTITYKKVIGGLLMQLMEKRNAYLEKIIGDHSEAFIHETAHFAADELKIGFPDNFHNLSPAQKAEYLIEKLNRPIRICGMVKNEGEPGGGPFWVQDANGNSSLQIVESSQIEMSDDTQKEILANATHFNPVDLVCSLKDYRGRAFDLTKFVDPKTGFISIKSKNGKDLKAQELPGLWNGAMANWISIFVEVPIETFNPVKTVNDLLRPQHQ